jgi:RNA recognition motif-containing protein
MATNVVMSNEEANGFNSYQMKQEFADNPNLDQNNESSENMRNDFDPSDQQQPNDVDLKNENYDQNNENNNSNGGNENENNDGNNENYAMNDENNFNENNNSQDENNDNNNQNGDYQNNSQNDDANANNSNGTNNQPMEPEQFRKVFIGGLSYKTDDETLKNYFTKYGELVDYVVMKDSQSGRSRGFGFVTYSFSSMVDELMKNRPHIIDGRQVEPKRATPREDSGKTEVQMTVKKLFIGGLRDNLTEDDLKNYFGNYGNVIEAVIMKEKESNKSRGFGFVTFDDYDPVDKIIRKYFI